MKTSKVVFLVFLSLVSLCVVNTRPVKATDDSWTIKTTMPTARSSFGVAVVNGKIYAIGGSTDTWINTTEEYDPVTDTWTTRKSMPTKRGNFAVAVYQNKIYVIGGSGYVYPDISNILGVNEVYDPSTDTWETKTSMPTPREGAVANVINGKIYVMAGNRISGAAAPVLTNVTEVYDPETDSWASKAPMHNFYGVGFSSVASAEMNNKIYVISSYEAVMFPARFGTSTQIYDPANDTWSYGTPIPNDLHYAAAGATAGVTHPERLYVIGGAIGPDATNLNQIYYPEMDVWSVGAPMPTARSSLGVAVVNDTLYAIGGFNDGNYGHTNKNEQYTPGEHELAPPELRMLSPENRTYNMGNVPLVFTVNEPTSWVRYSLDNQMNVTITGNVTLTGLSNGLHNLIVYARDVAGNTGTSETIYFSVAQQSEPFPITWIVAAIAIVAIGIVITLGVAVYRRKRFTIQQ